MADSKGKLKYTVDEERRKSWKAFAMCMTVADEDAPPMAKAKATFELIDYLSGLKQADIVEACGGEDAGADDVMSFAVKLLADMLGKN
jgi:hypothetical protein